MSAEKKLLSEKTLGELVTEDYRRVEIFEKHGMDFCCGGAVTLAEACRENNLDLDKVVEEVEQLEREPTPSKDTCGRKKITFSRRSGGWRPPAKPATHRITMLYAARAGQKEVICATLLASVSDRSAGEIRQSVTQGLYSWGQVFSDLGLTSDLDASFERMLAGITPIGTP
ncbi:MAG: DUF542 domain-containing protein [Geoalkalibacter sp.]|uniref:DUF542 domain-containing protein n=1 Tax=Geoalkalibacter sp. TaxID=3041440 RepID=UPI003D09793F